MVKLTIGSAVVEVTLVKKVGKNSGKEYIEVLQKDSKGIDVKIGTLFQRSKGTGGWKQAVQDVTFQGDVYLQDGTKGLKAGDVQPETGLKIIEQTKSSGDGTYLELEGAASQFVRLAFYKSETGTTTLSMIVK